MAKVITENFRTGVTKDFFDSFVNENDIVVNNLSSSLDLAGFSNSEIETITTELESELDVYLPETQYYIFASSLDKETTISNSQKEKREFLRRVIFGNKVDDSNIRYMFDKNDWVSGTIYDAFDDQQDISTLNMYVTVLDGDINEGSYNVYKCLDNNDGSNSTEKPTSTSTQEIRLSDGYVWKYMFSVPPAEYIEYQTTNSLPYFPNSSVASTAKESVSDILIVESANTGIFAGLVLGALTLDSVAIDGSAPNYVATIQATNEPSATETTYTNMYIRFSDSEGYIFDINRTVKPDESNEIRVYFSSSLDVISTISSGDPVEIVPKISVSPSDGGGTNCIAYGILDSDGNLTDIQFSERGTKYTYAEAELALPPSLGGVNVTLRPIVSPKGGHGFDPVSELYMSKIVVNTNFFSSSLTNIPDSNTYTKVGIVKNPTFRDGTYPSDIDNRLILTSNTDISSDIIAANSYLTQGNNVKGRIHEVEYNSSSDTTNVYVVDYTGGYNETFSAGEVTVKTSPTSSDSAVFTINTVTQGNYNPYSGEIYHFVDFESITRSSDKKEKVKFVFDF